MVIEFYYHSQSPPSCVVWMVLKELGIEYKGIFVDLLADAHKKDDFKKINANMQVPAIKDGDCVLSESRAIAMYLCTKYEKADKKDKLYPRDPQQAAKFHALLFRDVDNYHKIANYLNGDAVFEGKAKGVVEALLPKAKAVLTEYEANLADKNYMFGNHLTFLDFSAAHTVSSMALSGFDKWDEFPNLKKWKTNLAKLPYFEECIKKPVEKNKKMMALLYEKGLAGLAELMQPKK